MTDGVPMWEGAAQDLERVYEEYTPLLLSALASLVRRGYRLQPAEGLELVHDFYLEALPGLQSRYDPSKGKFSTYVYGAFVRFAQARLLREARWKQLLVPFEAALAHVAAVEPDPGADASIAAVTRALDQLPRDLRVVIDGRVRRNESERELAKRLGLSRYVVRQRLAEALGRLAIALGEDHAIREDLRPLAIRLWRDQQPLMKVAIELGLSRHQAREQLHGLIRSLSAAAGSLGR
jgi:RNA polymerase sigma factor (sigma-70 family)